MNLINEIEQQIKELKLTLKQLKIQEKIELLSFDELNVVRPYIQLLKAWNEGYSTNRQKSWQQYLVEAATPLQKTWKVTSNKQTQQVEFHILRYQFVNLYKQYSHLFLDKNNKIIPKPPSGPRVNGPFHEQHEVHLWVCDNPYCTTLSQNLMSSATIYDRYFCPNYKSCGGVLIPKFSH